MKIDWNYIEKRTQSDYEALEGEGAYRERCHMAMQVTMAHASIWFVSGDDMIDIRTGNRLRWDESAGMFLPNGSQQPPQC
jgi:hypothetical protein